MEPEFARVLAVAAREGNTLLSAVLALHDDGRLRVLTRKDPLQATGAHISIVGHITTEELARRLADTEVANGFANRLLFTCVRRSKLLPDGGRPDRLPRPPGRACRPLRQPGADHRTGASLPSGRLALGWRLPPIRGWSWGTGRCAGRAARGPDPSPVGGVRAAGRLGGHRARPPGSGPAVWRYCEASALFIFGDSLGDPIADRLLAAIREAGTDGLDTTAQHQVFGRNVPAARLAMLGPSWSAVGWS